MELEKLVLEEELGLEKRDGHRMRPWSVDSLLKFPKVAGTNRSDAWIKSVSFADMYFFNNVNRWKTYH